MSTSAMALLGLIAALLCLSISAAPLHHPNPLATPFVRALSSSHVHHPTLRPLPTTAGLTAWTTDRLPRSPPTSAAPAPCPQPSLWNVSLPLLTADLLFAYPSCQLITLLTCDSQDDCPTNVTATDYRTGELVYTIPYANSSNDVPVGAALLLSTDSSLVLVQRESVEASTANETCNTLSAYKAGAEVWKAAMCVTAPATSIPLFTFDVVRTPDDVVLWWMVVQRDDGGYETHYATIDMTGKTLYQGSFEGGIGGLLPRNEGGLLLVGYIPNTTSTAESWNATKLSSAGVLTPINPFVPAAPALLLGTTSQVVTFLNFSMTSLFGQDVLSNKVVWTLTEDDILFQPYTWLQPYDGFELVYTSYDEYLPDPSKLLVNAVAENTQTNQLVSIAALYDTTIGRRVATSPVFGPIPGDGNTILLQFVEFTDGGAVPIILVGHHFWAVDAVTLAVLANGEKPYGELDSYTMLVSALRTPGNGTMAFSSVTISQEDQYLVDFVGKTIYANASGVEKEGVRETRVAVATE